MIRFAFGIKFFLYWRKLASVGRIKVKELRKNINFFPIKGGSLAVAHGFEKSGLSKWLAVILKSVLPPEKEWTLIIILLFKQFGTEVFLYS